MAYQAERVSKTYRVSVEELRAFRVSSVKKPYNPVLGEFFRCTYSYPDGTEAFYVAEQVSHHPVRPVLQSRLAV